MILIDELIKRRDLLQKTIKWAQDSLNDVPDGHLRVSQTNSRNTFYLVTSQTGRNGTYLSRKEHALVSSLAKKDYAEQILKCAKRELYQLERYIRFIENSKADSLYSKLCPARKKLVTPALITDEEFALNWAQAPYIKSDYKPEMKIYPTKKGDMVRSKSEVILADMYLDMGIPYRYEQVIKLGKDTFSPDFTLLDKKRRKEIYHEHFGRMDDPVYRERNLKKIDDYRRNGIFFGKNLIATFEGDGAVLNMHDVREMITEIFL